MKSENEFLELLELRKSTLLDVEKIGKDMAGTVELDQSKVGRLSRMDAMQIQAMSQETNRRRQQELVRIDGAILRIENGEYGECLSCGNEIVEARLRFDPSILFCIDCASRQES